VFLGTLADFFVWKRELRERNLEGEGEKEREERKD
jgi:hypothetical protein